MEWIDELLNLFLNIAEKDTSQKQLLALRQMHEEELLKFREEKRNNYQLYAFPSEIQKATNVINGCKIFQEKWLACLTLACNQFDQPETWKIAGRHGDLKWLFIGLRAMTLFARENEEANRQVHLEASLKEMMDSFLSRKTKSDKDDKGLLDTNKLEQRLKESFNGEAEANQEEIRSIVQDCRKSKVWIKVFNSMMESREIERARRIIKVGCSLMIHCWEKEDRDNYDAQLKEMLKAWIEKEPAVTDWWKCHQMYLG